MPVPLKMGVNGAGRRRRSAFFFERFTQLFSFFFFIVCIEDASVAKLTSSL